VFDWHSCRWRRPICTTPSGSTPGQHTISWRTATTRQTDEGFSTTFAELPTRVSVPLPAPRSRVCAFVDSIDRYFINHKKNNNCKLKQYSGRLPEGIHHQSWSPEHIHVIFITITNRPNTDKQNHTKDKKEKGGQRELEHMHN